MKEQLDPNVTQLGQHCGPTALDAIVPHVEAELRRLAASYMRNERPGHTLQPTALVNEAWIRMAQQEQPQYEGRSHFVAVAAQYMRQILVEYARRKGAKKRGSRAARLDLEDVTLFSPERSTDLLALDEGLTELSRLDSRQARIIELHFFGGLTLDEIADLLAIGRTTVVRDIRMAQVWLKSFVAGQPQVQKCR